MCQKYVLFPYLLLRVNTSTRERTLCVYAIIHTQNAKYNPWRVPVGRSGTKAQQFGRGMVSMGERK